MKRARTAGALVLGAAAWAWTPGCSTSSQAPPLVPVNRTQGRAAPLLTAPPAEAASADRVHFQSLADFDGDPRRYYSLADFDGDPGMYYSYAGVLRQVLITDWTLQSDTLSALSVTPLDRVDGEFRAGEMNLQFGDAKNGPEAPSGAADKPVPELRVQGSDASKVQQDKADPKNELGDDQRRSRDEAAPRSQTEPEVSRGKNTDQSGNGRPANPAPTEPAPGGTDDKPAAQPSPTKSDAPAAPSPTTPAAAGTPANRAPEARSPSRGSGGGEKPKRDADSATGSSPAPGASRGAPTVPPPSGPATGRPAVGPSLQERLEHVDMPKRVGADDNAVRELAALGASLERLEQPKPRFDEELVVIVRPDQPPTPRRGPEKPGAGALLMGQTPATMLETKVAANVAGPISRVSYTQRFENPLTQASDAIYVLPLPRDAAITDFIMTIGTRRIRGIIRERADAERIFLNAQHAGKLATLLREDRDSLFVQKIGNLAAAGRIDVTVSYFSTLNYTPEGYELVLPLTMATKFHGASAADEAGRAPGAVSVEVEIDAGTPLEAITCPTHAIELARSSDREARVTLKPAALVPNRDFVLRYAVAPSAAHAGLTAGIVTQKDITGTYFSMLILPPAGVPARKPVDLVLLPDLSAGMTPAAMALMRQACLRLISTLAPGDRVSVVTGAGELTADPAGAAAAIAAIQTITAPGAADFERRFRAALAGGEPGRERVICLFAATDADAGLNLMRDARALLGDARVYCFGVGTEPPGYVQESLARIGRGGVLHLDRSTADRVIDTFARGDLRPVVSEVEIDWNGAEVVDVFPRRIPDLYAGRPVHVVGRLLSPPHMGKPIRVLGVADGESGPRAPLANVEWSSLRPTASAIHTIWARAKVLSLSERLASADSDVVRREMVELALAHNLVSTVSSLIAVDAMSEPAPAAGIVGSK